MRFIITAIFLALSISVSAQTEEQQKQKKKDENSSSRKVEVKPSSGFWSLRDVFYPTYPTYSYPANYNRSRKSYSNVSTDFSFGAAIAVGTTINQPTQFGAYLTIRKDRGMFLNARTSKSNPYKYYDNINRLEAEQWGDQYQGEHKQLTSLDIGYLLKQNLIYHIIGIGIQTIKSDLNYIDPTGILPYRGDNLYSIERETKVKVYPVYGILHQVPKTNLELGIQTSIQRQPIIQATIGLSF